MTEVVVVTTGTLEDVEIICNKLLSDHHRYHINTQINTQVFYKFFTCCMIFQWPDQQCQSNKEQQKLMHVKKKSTHYG